MGIRKNVRNLTDVEKKQFVDALLELKRNGVYDRFVQWHLDAMDFATPSVGNDFVGIARNAAHRGPSFLPWHREYLRRLELELQSINSNVSLPYWDWVQDANDPKSSPVWSDNFMGGNGKESEGWRVMDGPFSHDKGDWVLTVDTQNGGPALRRRFGRLEWLENGNIRGLDWTFPTNGDVNLAMAERVYDVYPWDAGRLTIGFRNKLEGWSVDPNFENTTGTQLHNRVHVWVGGQWVQGGEELAGTMLLGSSPNDPIFFLHHCYIDKLWADWQTLQRQQNPNATPHYSPISDGPHGHNLYDPIYPWGGVVTPASVLDHRKLDYSYDTDSDPRFVERLMSLVGSETMRVIREEKEIPVKSHFLMRQEQHLRGTTGGHHH